MSNHDRSNHGRGIKPENPGVYIAMKSAVILKVSFSLAGLYLDRPRRLISTDAFLATHVNARKF